MVNSQLIYSHESIHRMSVFFIHLADDLLTAIHKIRKLNPTVIENRHHVFQVKKGSERNLNFGSVIYYAIGKG